MQFNQFMIASTKIVSSSPFVIMRRRSDQTLRRRICFLLVGVLTFNSGMFYLIFHLDVIVSHIRYEGVSSVPLHDQILLFGWVVSFSIVIALIFAMQKMQVLLSDIHNLANALDREKDIKNRQHKLESLGLLAAGISHEINTCLQTVLGSCEMAHNREENDVERKSYLQRAIDNSLHARKVINNVLAFAGAGDLQYDNFEILKVDEVVQEAIEYSRACLPNNIQIQFDSENNSDSNFASINQVSLVQVISNLITNAAHAMSYQGSIVVTTGVKIFSEDVITKEVPKGSYIFISIKDSGYGMMPDIAEKIFDPFFTTKPIGEGTGLGLSIVHGLIKSMRGYITVTSVVDEGSEFIVYLPIKQGE